MTDLYALAYGPLEEDDYMDDEDEEDDPEPVEGEDYYVHSDKITVPYPIIEEQFTEELVGFFDKMTLHLYLGDSVLLTEFGELVDDSYRTVGDLSEFLNGGHDGDEFYVRNEIDGADYMVIVKDGYGVDNMKGD